MTTHDIEADAITEDYITDRSAVTPPAAQPIMWEKGKPKILLSGNVMVRAVDKSGDTQAVYIYHDMLELQKDRIRWDLLAEEQGMVIDVLEV